VDALPAPAAVESFRRPVLRGLAWKTASRVIFESSKVVVGVVLARLLTPVSYGVAGMVLVIVAFEPALAGVAVASFLVRRREVDEDDRSTVFWTCVAIGCTATAAGVALSWPAARFYGQPQVQPLFAVLSLIFVISSLGATHAHLLVREMNFRALELRAMAGALIGGALAVALAVAGFGPWALVAQPLAAATISTILLWVFGSWRPRRRYSRRSLREIRSFGGNVSGMLVLFQLNQNADNVLIGRFLGAQALGAYALAYNIILVPFSRLASPLHDVLYPVFTRLQDDAERLARVWLRAVRLLAAVAAPAMLLLVVCAPDLVHVVFGPKWAKAAPVMQILAWVGALYVVQGLNSVLLQALGRTRLLLRYALLSFAAGLGSFVLGLRWGIVGVAVCFAGVLTVIGPVYMTLAARAVGAGGRDVIRAVAGVIAAALVAALGAGALRLFLLHAGAPAGLRLLLVAGCGALLYAACCPILAGGVIDELRALRRRAAS
jgi:O-antigen/teichoic acid export membrane protein